ncbi:MAG: HAMP domain-containing histidine kinase [Microbacterium sp.]|uniref:sensor histidine kinase n=1 Tax=Microbacterium sp. TaxID=51671 RepID=UPI001ACB901E|nr:HAMP domain-containing sensor histidine kinase [Microbacterium sp.]MBN9177846.1 HAMP domain-containing histidine kinase [Microbacterium sp.]
MTSPETAHPRRRSLALRLTVLSTAAFALAAAILLVAEYFLLQYVVEVSVEATTGSSSQGENPGDLDGKTIVFRVAKDLADTVMLLSIVTAAVMVLLAGIAVWFVARKSLGRIAGVTALTRAITEQNLDQRLDLAGPKDEIKDLGDTIDEMLSRLHAAFEQQDSFVANASHELRTPLAGIRASLEASLLHDEIADAPRAAMSRALVASSRAESILTALLQLARARRVASDHAEVVDLREVVSAVVGLFEEDRFERMPSSVEDVRLIRHSFELDLEEATILGDEVLITQAVQNLVGNAILHGAANEPIVIQTRVHAHPEYELSVSGMRSTPGAAVLLVRSGGEIIAPAVAAKLVEPFNRGARTRHNDAAAGDPGIGLGLSIVRAIAQQHGGWVSVNPQAAGGLEVEVTLPSSTEETITL